MAVYTIFYHNPKTGRRLAPMDADCGETYLANLARMQDRDDDIAVAVRADHQEPNLYLTPSSHEWTTEVPEVMRQQPTEHPRPIPSRVPASTGRTPARDEHPGRVWPARP